MALGLGTANSQREYYLTDVVGIAAKAGDRVVAVLAAGATEVLGVNDRMQLAQVEACYRANRTRALMVAGATLADPGRVDVRGGEVASSVTCSSTSTSCSSARCVSGRA